MACWYQNHSKFQRTKTCQNGSNFRLYIMTPLGTFLQSNLDASIQDRKLHHRCRIYYTSQLIIIVFEYYNTYCYYLKCYPQKTTTCEIIQRSNFTFFSRAICKKNRIWFFCVYVCLPPPQSSVVV